jgi:hypothetical protein
MGFAKCEIADRLSWPGAIPNKEKAQERIFLRLV